MVQTSKARTLYSMFVPNVQYDDLVICNSQGVYKNGTSLLDQINQQLNNHYAGLEKNSIEDGLKLYPNHCARCSAMRLSHYR
jgi:hypothetical protein